MRSLGRYLALVAVLSMGLPPAWCCVWPAKVTVAKAVTPPVDAPPACPHCKPTPKPVPDSPPPVSPCCCVDDDGRVGATFELVKLEPAAVLWHAVAFDLAVSPVRVAVSEVPARRGQWPPIHVWNCLYLC